MNDRVLANRYAQAFYTIFPQACSVKSSDLLHQMNQFFSGHKKILFLLSLPQLTIHDKKKALQTMVHAIGLPEVYCTLYMLLMQHKRTFLITEVGIQLRRLILQKNNIQECEIVSSVVLTDEAQRQLRLLFEKKIRCTIMAHYTVDTSLIAGIALKSDTLAWEYSVRKQLHMIKQSLLG